MLLGQDSFSAQPFSTSPFLGNVAINITGVPLQLTIGPVGIDTTVANVVSGADALTLRTAQVGTFTVSGNANITDNLKNPLTLGTGTVGIVIAANPTTTGTNLTLKLDNGSNIIVKGNAVVDVNGIPMTLTTKTSGVITWNEILPGANMIWTPIEPY